MSKGVSGAGLVTQKLYPLQMQQLLNSTVGLIPHTGTTTTQGSQTDYGGGFDLAKFLPFMTNHL